MRLVLRASGAFIGGMRIVIHDYAGHAFPIPLSRALAAAGHEVVHAYASALQTPRGDLQRKDDDPAGFGVREIAMDPDYARYKYSFVRRRRMEVAYGREAGKFIRDWRPDVVVSGDTPTEAQEPLVAATVGTGGKFFYWVQDFYSIAVDKLCRRKIPLVGGLVGGYYRRLDGRQFARSAGIIAITDDFIPILRDDSGCRRKRWRSFRIGQCWRNCRCGKKTIRGRGNTAWRTNSFSSIPARSA